MSTQNTISLSLTPKQRAKLKETFNDSLSSITPPYAEYQLKVENCTITSYQSGKVVFQGSDAEIYASPFQTTTLNTYPQAGSDEVGTGDYFGPVVVCASIVTAKQVDTLNALGIRDSKALKDQDILKVAPQLLSSIPHSLLIVSPKKYNEVHQSENLNAIKALLHNQAYLNLQKKQKLPSFCVIDQFTPKSSYYRYLKGQPKIVQDLHFETKAEDKYLAVAVSSVLARYAFLKEMEKMEAKWNMVFHKGGGALADQSAKEFVETHGRKALEEVAKIHFKNTQKIE
ncbi:MAG: ribonuclease HIII [Solobacterium sp.]|nr:ribonuclease HIII [Solobacterium sp.]